MERKKDADETTSSQENMADGTTNERRENESEQQQIGETMTEAPVTQVTEKKKRGRPPKAAQIAVEQQKQRELIRKFMSASESKLSDPFQVSNKVNKSPPQDARNTKKAVHSDSGSDEKMSAGGSGVKDAEARVNLTGKAHERDAATSQSSKDKEEKNETDGKESRETGGAVSTTGEDAANNTSNRQEQTEFDGVTDASATATTISTGQEWTDNMERRVTEAIKERLATSLEGLEQRLRQEIRETVEDLEKKTTTCEDTIRELREKVRDTAFENDLLKSRIRTDEETIAIQESRIIKLEQKFESLEGRSNEVNRENDERVDDGQPIENGDATAGESERIRRDLEREIREGEQKCEEEKPKKLAAAELATELAIRTERKHNIVVTGISTIGNFWKRDLQTYLEEQMQTPVKVMSMFPLGEKKAVLSLCSLKNKIEIMKIKSNWRASRIWIEDDLTDREKEIQTWLNHVADVEIFRGNHTRIGYAKIRINGQWMAWNEKTPTSRDRMFEGRRAGETTPIKRQNLNGISWNLSGAYKIRRAWHYLQNFDLIFLQETWTEKKGEDKLLGSLDQDYIWHMKPAVRTSKKGRAKGGVLIGVRKEHGAQASFKEWEYGMIVENLKTNTGETFNIIATYSNEGTKKLVSSLDAILEEAALTDKILIIGDLNARTGTETGDENEPTRNSEDRTLNKEGEKLLKFVEREGFSIKNGRTNGDWKGELTYVGDGGNSVLDYILERSGINENLVTHLKVEKNDKIAIVSDHLPVTFQIGQYVARAKAS